MIKEIAKWLADIAKYMVTALLLGTVFADMSDTNTIWTVACIAAAILGFGMFLFYLEDKKEKKQNNKKKGNRK